MTDPVTPRSCVPWGDASKGEIEILEERLVHDSPFVEVYDDKVKFPSGNEGQYFRWYWKGPYGVTGLPVLPDGSVALVNLYRHADRDWRLEAPRGFGAEGHSPHQAMTWELREEVGMTAERFEEVRVIGSARHPVHLFLCHGRFEGEATPEPDETIRGVQVFQIDEIPALIADPRIHDPETLVLLQAYLLRTRNEV